MNQRDITETALRACDGSDLAFERLCREFAPMLRRTVNRYYGPGLDRDDLLQEARLGLHAACVSFDPSRRVSFSALAAVAVERNVITAVKASQRHKYSPLNNSRSLDAPVIGDRTLGDYIAASPFLDPARQAETREDLARLALHLNATMSCVEATVLGRILGGASLKTAGTGLGTGDPEKMADNAMQRVRRKAREALAA